MARQFQEYQGAVPQAAQVGGLQVPFFGGIPQNGAAVDGAIGQALDTGVRVARLHDLGLQQRVAQERERIRSEMDVEMQQAAELPMGSAESLFRADGSVNSDRYDAIVAKYWEACDRIEPGEFALGENAVRYAGEQEEERNGLALRMMKFAALRSLDNTRKAFSDNLELAVAKEDWGAARGLVEDARGCLLNDAEAEMELLKLQRGQLRAASRSAGYGGAARVNVGGTEYSGLSAALAMERARNGGAATCAPVMGEQSAPAQDAEAQEAAAAGESAVGEAVPMSEAGAWDAGRALTLMPQGEFDEVVDAFSAVNRVLTLPRADGGVEVCCAPEAPECVQRAAAVGNAQGAVNPEAARGMVARLTMDAVTQDNDATAEQICKMFDDSGIYEALGDGDAEAGKVRTMQVVHEMVRRGTQGTLALDHKAVERVVDARLAEPDFGKGREWKEMEGLNPRVEKGKAWDKSKQDERNKKRWFALFDVYRKYRDEFNPLHKEGEADKKEFEPLAQDFYDWYMGRSHKYKDLKKAEMDAARDWYCAKVYEGLLGNVDVGKDGKAGYGSYASDVAVMRAALRQTPPRNLGAEERMQMLEDKEKNAADRGENFRRRAADDYARLREMKRVAAENGEKEQRKKAAADAKAKREEERERKRLEGIETRKRNAARALPRMAEWEWNGEDGADGEMPACTVPEEEYRRLVEELGYDGSQVVYVQVAGAKIQVVGANKKGRMALNTAAVAKVQKKPNAKRGERWKYRGNLGYSYYFKNVGR